VGRDTATGAGALVSWDHAAMRWLVFIACRLLLGCGARAEPQPVPTAPAPSTASAVVAPAVRPIEITLREEHGDRWLVTYRFEKPVRGIAFERLRNKFRAAKWTIAVDNPDSHAAWGLVADREAVVARAPFSELKITFDTDTEEKVADYLLNARFSEGSRLLYTGHFAARVLACPGEAPCEPSALTMAPSILATDFAWHFETAKDRNIQLLSERKLGKLDWSPTEGQPSGGTYACFGNIEPVETPYGTMILDPGLPKWMLDSGERAIPKLLAWFEAETKTKLTFRPLMLVSAPKVESSGRSAKGGVLGRVVQLAVWGDGWQTENDDARQGWLKFFAHELFHFWNGGMFDTRDGAPESWLSEGSSDYFSYRALRALDVLDDRIVRDKLAEDANHCMLSLRDPLVGKPSDARPEYSCGAVAWAVADGVARAHGQTAATVLGGVFAKSADKRYGTDDVVAAFRALEPKSPALDFVEQLLRKGLPDTNADAAFEEALTRAGVDVVRVAPSKAKTKSARLLMSFGAQLARCDCGRRVAVTSKEDALFFHDVPECAALRAVRVVGYEKHAIPKDAALAFDALMGRKDAKRITVMTEAEGKQKPLTLTCRDGYTLPFAKLLAAK
jgi:hypothetical protein